MSKWFLVENHLHQKEALVAARVPFAELDIAKPRTIKGLAFPEEEKARVLEILGLSSASFIEAPTDRKGVFLLMDQRFGVILESPDNMEYWKDIEPVLQDYAKLLGMKIFVSNPHGRVSKPKNQPGQLYIRFWSAPVSTPSQNIHSAFGIDLEDGQDDALRISKRGVPIVDSNGTPVAEVVKGTLYVLFDLPHGRNAGTLMRAIMEQFTLLQKSPEEVERIRREIAERELQHSREAYIRECGYRLQFAIEETQQCIQKAEKTIREAQQTLTKAVRDEIHFREKLNWLLSSGEKFKATLAREFDNLVQLPGVEKVLVRDGIISVFTENIEIPFNGVVYDIGKFRIDIHSSGAQGGVRCFNLTGQRNGYFHPHIEGNGACCLGNIADGVAKLIGAYEFSVLVQVMLQYLRSVNPDSWYLHINNWPVKSSEEVKDA